MDSNYQTKLYERESTGQYVNQVVKKRSTKCRLKNPVINTATKKSIAYWTKETDTQTQKSNLKVFTKMTRKYF